VDTETEISINRAVITAMGSSVSQMSNLCC
jgi:hypothetical protein